jgi:putative spermidine/putrescine transport system permease protein
MRSPGRILVWVAAICAVLLLIVPTLIVIPVSFGDRASFRFPPHGWSLRWYRELLDEPAWRTAFGHSILIATLSALTAAIAGTAAALGLRRFLRSINREIVRSTLLVPLIVPEIVLAVGLYSFFLKAGLVGTLTGFVLAHATLGIPLVVTTVTASLAGFDPNLERAAASLGSGPWSTARHVTVPLIMPGLLAGALFAFILSLDNLVMSLFIQTPDLSTLPVLMWSSMTRDTDPTIAAAATVILLTTTVIISVALALLGRRGSTTERGPLL